MQGVRLNLGAGETNIPGFLPLDIKRGDCIYPLPYADGSVREIRASHVLEHFSHREVPAVLADWARALAPGGLLRVAVPDFQTIAEQYLAGNPWPTEGYVMGGHVDADDRHGALFDQEHLTGLLSQAGLLGVCRWESEIEDCAALPVSLNLQAVKPPERWPKVVGVMSVPRLGFTDMRACAAEALMPLGIAMRDVQGAYWGQCLTRGMESAIEAGAEHILTMDYDSVFTRRDVENLLSAAMRHPEADAIAPIQAHRSEGRQLFVAIDDDGKVITEVPREHFSRELVRVRTAHFGLTLLRVDALQRTPHPWFWGQPDSDGRWSDGRLDDDVWFWQQWGDAGNTAYIAPRVPIGHLELMVRWPDSNLGVTYRTPAEFREHGKPEGIWR